MNTVFITGADRGVGYSLCEYFLQGGWHVIAGQYMPAWPQLQDLQKKQPQLDILPLDVSSTASVQAAAEKTAQLCDHLDLLVNCAGIIGNDSYDSLRAVLSTNTLGALRMVEAFLPLMHTGLRRLAFVSSEAGSISVAHRQGGCTYTMSKTALNMLVRRMFRTLSPQGFTFRLYHPGWVRSYMSGEKTAVGDFEPEEAAAEAYRQFTQNRETEDVLVMTDISGEMWPY
jgi:NAD(P)-dependent dehydrogenase (short-subunit alcohol dehydrogenase family)